MNRLGVLFVFVVTLSGPLMAQAPTGTVAGTVFDQVAAVIPHATVTVTNKDTGGSRVVQTGVDGTFSIPSLPPGPYDVIVRAEARNVDELGKLVVARVQGVDGITRTLTCPVVHI